MSVVKSRLARSLLMTLAWLFVGIGFIGIAIPGLPTTGPILLAAFLFSKSSERFDDWLVNNRLFGGIVRDWRAGEGFTVRAKSVAVAAIAFSFGVTTYWFVTGFYGRAAMWTLAIAIAAYIVSRPTKRTAAVGESASV